MRSSIFNFSRALAFPLKVAAAATALILAYNVLIAVVRPNMVLNYDAGMRNRIIAEQFANGDTPSAVLVGSSVTFRLSADFMEGDFLGPQIFNLGLAAGSSTTGMDIILRKSTMPRLIFVEVNRLEHHYDPKVAAQLYDKQDQALWQYLPGLRFENRPLDLVIVSAWKGLKYLLSTRNVVAVERVYTPSPPTTTPDADDLTKIDPKYGDLIKANLDQLGSQIDQARKAGTKVVLVYYPTHPTIDAASTERHKQRVLLERFPRAQYDWFDLRTAENYQTDDGVHLVRSSAQRMATLFRQMVETAPNL